MPHNRWLVAPTTSVRCSESEHGVQDRLASAAEQILLGYGGTTEIMKEIIGAAWDYGLTRSSTNPVLHIPNWDPGSAMNGP